MLLASIFNETTFKEILFPSSGNVNDFATHIYRKYEHLERKNRACRPGRKEVE